MGCWNETCGFSQQSIGAGDTVIVFPILLNHAPVRDVYACGTAQPIAFPVEAKYNDYGSIEKPVLGFATESTLALFNQWYKKGDLIVSESGYDDIAAIPYGETEADFSKEKGFDSIEALFYAIERDYLTLKYRKFNGQEHACGIAFMMISKDVLDTAIGTVLDCDDYDFRDASLQTYDAEIQHMLNTLSPSQDQKDAKQAMRDLEKAIDAIENSPEQDTVELEKLQKQYSSALRMSHYFNRPWADDMVCDSPVEGRHYNVCSRLTRLEIVNTSAFRDLYKILETMYSPETNDDIKQTIMRFMLTIDAFTLFRKSWMPQAHASQYDNMFETITFMERMLTKLYQKRIEMYEDGYLDGYEAEDVYGHPKFKV